MIPWGQINWPVATVALAVLVVLITFVLRLTGTRSFLRELCTDNEDRLSQNKIWAHIAKAAATAVYVKQGLFTNPPPPLESLAWLTLVYTGIVGGSELAAKAMNMKWGGGNSGTTTPTTGGGKTP